MLRRHPFLIPVIVLLVASLACSQTAPTAAPINPDALNTSIAQTVAARQTEAALNVPSATATLTFTLEPPTATLEPTLTPDYTPTSDTPMITVDVDTNCRTGPGSIFERVGVLLVGETAEVVGRGQNSNGQYWYIRNPDDGPEFCWVWGEYATVTGNTLPLLYLSPEPLPVSNFVVAFQNIETCSVWWADFKLTNTTAGLFKSVSLVLTDADTNTVANLTENKFISKHACETPKTTDSLIAGGTVTLSSPPLGYNPKGHNLHAKITICTDADQQGICLTQELSFKP